jgi:transcriptional regulator with XRE-family HTH domain
MIASNEVTVAPAHGKQYFAFMNVGDEVRALRAAGNLTQPDLATRAGLSVTQISNIERGHNTSVETLGRIADALNVPLLRLFGQIEESDIPGECRSLVSALVGLSPEEKRRFAVVAEAFAAALRGQAENQEDSSPFAEPSQPNDGEFTLNPMRRSVSSTPVAPTLPGQRYGAPDEPPAGGNEGRDESGRMDSRDDSVRRRTRKPKGV